MNTQEATHSHLSDVKASSEGGIVAEAQEIINNYLKPGVGTERCVKYYDETSEKYEQYVEAFDYSAPRQAAKAVADLYPDKSKLGSVRILDVAAGTGLVGLELQNLGFRLMDALDPSQGMLDIAAKRGIYDKLFCEYINDKKLPIPENTYDALVIAGGMGENQIPCSALREMIRLVKPGGYIVNVTRVEHLQNCSDYKGRLEQLMASLQSEGRWKQITWDTFPNFLRGKEGLLLVHQVL